MTDKFHTVLVISILLTQTFNITSQKLDPDPRIHFEQKVDFQLARSRNSLVLETLALRLEISTLNLTFFINKNV